MGRRRPYPGGGGRRAESGGEAEGAERVGRAGTGAEGEERQEGERVEGAVPRGDRGSEGLEGEGRESRGEGGAPGVRGGGGGEGGTPAGGGGSGGPWGGSPGRGGGGRGGRASLCRLGHWRSPRTRRKAACCFVSHSFPTEKSERLFRWCFLGRRAPRGGRESGAFPRGPRDRRPGVPAGPGPRGGGLLGPCGAWPLWGAPRVTHKRSIPSEGGARRRGLAPTSTLHSGPEKFSFPPQRQGLERRPPPAQASEDLKTTPCKVHGDQRALHLPVHPLPDLSTWMEVERSHGAYGMFVLQL